MKHTPLFLLGLTLVAFYGPAAAQTTPPSAPKASPGKGAPRLNRAAAPLRTAPMSAVRMDTAAFRRSGRPHDSILNRERDISSKKKN